MKDEKIIIQFDFEDEFINETADVITSRIDKGFPANLVTDFEVFINYCKNNVVSLTKTKEHISRKQLPAINTLLLLEEKDCSAYTEQEYYPYIHFLYHLALSSRLLAIMRKSRKLQLMGTERIDFFMALNDSEKYCFILETFWVDMDWRKIANNSRDSVSLSYEAIFTQLIHDTPGDRLSLTNAKTEISRFIGQQTLDWHYFFLYFEWLGIWRCEEDLERKVQRNSKSVYYARNLTVTSFGVSIMPILLFSRNLSAWNIAFRRTNGEINPIPGSPIDQPIGFHLTEEDYEQVLLNVEVDHSDEPFFNSLICLFPENEPKQTLPRNRKKIHRWCLYI